MKQQIHTIPVVEAYETGEECPFCALRRQTEQRAIRYYAGPGASYMEPGIRGLTNRSGFCGEHIKKLYDFGNTLGGALILQTHCEDILEDLKANLKPAPKAKRSLFGKKKATCDSYWQHLRQRSNACVICDRVEENMARQYRVFFDLLKEPEFREMIANSKGMCVPHFTRLMEEAEEHLPNAHRQWFYDTVYPLMLNNLERVKADLDWLISMYDYRNAGKDWGNSRDSLQRMMLKLQGVNPTEPPYRNE